MTEASKKANIQESELQRVLYIQYLTKFGLQITKVLIDSNSKVNTIWSNFVE